MADDNPKLVPHCAMPQSLLDTHGCGVTYHDNLCIGCPYNKNELSAWYNKVKEKPRHAEKDI